MILFYDAHQYVEKNRAYVRRFVNIHNILFASQNLTRFGGKQCIDI